MGALPDAISLNCHSNEDSNMVHVTWPQHMCIVPSHTCFTSHYFWHTSVTCNVLDS
jgi:hypothetical protein